jgi:hypothetical protein
MHSTPAEIQTPMEKEVERQVLKTHCLEAERTYSAREIPKSTMLSISLFEGMREPLFFFLRC